MKYNLPRGYLSFSSMSLWKSSKDSFRKKYYSTQQYDIDTPYTRFGKEIAEILEDDERVKEHPILSTIPRYATPEYQIEEVIADVPIKAYLDSFCPDSLSILEYKTGIRGANGSPTWNQQKVRKHDQLPLYSLLVKTRHGDVNPDLQLVWMETEWAEVCHEENFNGKTFKACGPELRLTGYIKIFNRHISDWEHEKMRQQIVDVATQITEDYTRYQATGDNAIDKSVPHIYLKRITDKKKINDDTKTSRPTGRRTGGKEDVGGKRKSTPRTAPKISKGAQARKGGKRTSSRRSATNQ